MPAPMPAAGEGEGEPPCSPWIDPDEWASRLRISRCSKSRLEGTLGPDEYLPGMDKAEGRYVDDLARALAEFIASRQAPAEMGVGP
jgi:hypothetical protein